MKFALFYEIPVARPWTPGKEHQAYKDTHRAGDARRPDGLPRLLDGGAPLPRGVLALLQPRGPLRRGRGPHQEHPHRVRRAPPPQAVQPPDPHRGVGGGARPHLRRPGRLRDRTLVDARGARGLRRRSRRDARDVARGPRPHRRARGPRTSTRRRASTGRWARPAGCCRSRCSSRTRRSSVPPAASPGHEEIGQRGIGLCSFTVGLPPEQLAENIAMYRKGLAECEQPAGKFVNETAATFTMVLCAPTNEEATEVARESFEWYPKHGGGLIASVAEWQEERGVTGGQLGTYQYTGDSAEAQARGRDRSAHHRLPPRLRLRGDGRPRRVHRGRQALRGGRAATCCCAW